MSIKDPLYDLITAYLTAQGKIEAGITVEQITPWSTHSVWDVKLNLAGYETATVRVNNNELLGWLWSQVSTLVTKPHQ